MRRGGFGGPHATLVLAAAIALSGCSLLLDFDAAKDAGSGDAADTDGASPPGCDVGEPDDSFAMARPLDGELEAAICPKGDSDFYSFSITEGTGVVIDLRFSFDDGGDIDLRLFDGSEELRTLATGTGDNERIEKLPELGNPLPAGDYFLEVFSIAEQENQYSLSIDLDVPPTPDASPTDGG